MVTPTVSPHLQKHLCCAEVDGTHPGQGPELQVWMEEERWGRQRALVNTHELEKDSPRSVCLYVPGLYSTGSGFVLAAAPRWGGGAVFVPIWWEPSYILGLHTATKPHGIVRGPGRSNCETWTLRNPSF